LQQIFGAGLLDGKYVFAENFVSNDEQLAGFGQVSFRIIDKLMLIAGLRVTRTKFDFDEFDAGPVNGPTPRNTSGSERETPVTPKFGLSYQADENNLFYVTAAKGYRVGGGNIPIPTIQCAAALAQVGLTIAPDSYKSDTVWSYEIGGKSRMDDGRIRLDASAFHIDWKQIQEG